MISGISQCLLLMIIFSYRPTIPDKTGISAMDPVIVIHGGAGDIAESAIPGKLNGVRNAAEAGSQILLKGGSAMDAVIAAVKVMEDDTAFNAGHGAVLNLHGEIEMDALVMDGATLKAGAVGGVKYLEHPIELARLVMDKSPHVLLSGPGANSFAAEQGVPTVPAYRLVTQNAIDALEAFLQGNKSGATTEPSRFGEVGTVGAVAVDVDGNVASATSTGGITGKHPGRLGDTPLPGSGGYADNKTGAVSATGTGESIMRTCLSHRIVSSIANGKSPQEAVKEALAFMASTAGSTAGAIVVTRNGEIGINFISKRMAWAFKKGNNEIEVGIDDPPVLS